MQHLGTKTLETNRLVLRPFTLDDAHAMYYNWGSDPDVTKFLSWSPHHNLESTLSYLTVLIEDYRKPTTYEWGIELKSTGELIGSIGVVDLDGGLESTRIGYVIGKPWWHQGLTSEAFSRIIQFFMEEVGTNRIDARYDSRNIYSGCVLRKCGLTYEGTIKASLKNNQGICDATWYGLLKAEYFNAHRAIS